MPRNRVPPRPGRKCLPQYLLRCTSGWFDGANCAGMYYDGRNPANGMPRWVLMQHRMLCMQMCGAGLASAERSLKALGFETERVPA